MKRQFNQDIKVNGSIEANAIGDNLTLALKNFLLSTVYTVGSVFTSFNNDNPNDIFSDTVWVKLPEGTFLMQGGTNFPIKTLENIAESDGGGQAHNNLPPYKACNIWVRRA